MLAYTHIPLRSYNFLLLKSNFKITSICRNCTTWKLLSVLFIRKSTIIYLKYFITFKTSIFIYILSKLFKVMLTLTLLKSPSKDRAPSAKHGYSCFGTCGLLRSVWTAYWYVMGMPLCKTISDWFFRFLIANEINFNG